jgi:ankyrin repeat protein
MQNNREDIQINEPVQPIVLPEKIEQLLRLCHINPETFKPILQNIDTISTKDEIVANLTPSKLMQIINLTPTTNPSKISPHFTPNLPMGSKFSKLPAGVANEFFKYNATHKENLLMHQTLQYAMGFTRNIVPEGGVQLPVNEGWYKYLKFPFDMLKEALNTVAIKLGIDLKLPFDMLKMALNTVAIKLGIVPEREQQPEYMEYDKERLENLIKGIDAGLQLNKGLFNAPWWHWEDAALFIERQKHLDVNIPTKGKSTLLHEAIKDTNLEVVKLLLDRGADKNASDGEGQSALNYALRKNYETYDELTKNNSMEIVKMFLTPNIDPNEKDINENTFLHTAVLYNYEEEANLWLDLGANEYVENKDKLTSFYLAMRHINPKMGKLFLSRVNLNNVDLMNVEFNRKDARGETILHHAVYNGNKEIVKLCLELDSNMYEGDKNNITPFYLAMKNNDPEMVELFLKHEADFNREDFFGHNILQQAIINRDVAIANNIIDLFIAKPHKFYLTEYQYDYNIKLLSELRTELKLKISTELNVPNSYAKVQGIGNNVTSCDLALQKLIGLRTNQKAEESKKADEQKLSELQHAMEESKKVHEQNLKELDSQFPEALEVKESNDEELNDEEFFETFQTQAELEDYQAKVIGGDSQ